MQWLQRLNKEGVTGLIEKERSGGRPAQINRKTTNQLKRAVITNPERWQGYPVIERMEFYTVRYHFI
ncbi:MAG: hypothetical protein KJ826_07385 [Proteobacteria bacterium]|nr:hypothetical protein [Pseudomonadota bacterium]MBU4036141.1 hypothetical protein [Pseudomonadota bacterium]